MRKIFLVISLLCVAVPAYAGQDQFYGTLLGAGLGGYFGNQFGHGTGRVATTTGGVVVGGLIGGDIGQSMDRSNAINYGRAISYPPLVYYAPAYAPNYVAPPAPPPVSQDIYFDDDQTSYCREYSQLVHVGNRMQESYGTACLEPDGSWRVMQ